MDSSAVELARRIAKVEKAQRALGRASQISRSTLNVEGADVPVPDAIGQGAEAISLVDDLQGSVEEALGDIEDGQGDLADQMRDELDDLTLIPDAPTGLTVTSNVGSYGPSGLVVSTVTLTWDAVTEDITGADLITTGYDIESTFGGESVIDGQSDVESFTTTAWAPAAERTVRVRARLGFTVGEWSEDITVTPAVPAHVTTKPTPPTLTTGGGGVFIGWDGMLSDGPMPAGSQGVFAEYRIGTTGTFVRAVGPLSQGAGQVGQVRAAIGDIVQARLRWVDTLGRVSNVSDQRQITVKGIDMPDLDGAIIDAIDQAQSDATAAGVAAADAQSAAAQASADATSKSAAAEAAAKAYADAEAEAARLAAIAAASGDATAKAAAAEAAAKAAAAADASAKANAAQVAAEAKAATAQAAAEVAQAAAEAAAVEAIRALQTADGKNRIYMQKDSPGDNLFTNGSFEDAAGTVEVRRNYWKRAYSGVGTPWTFTAGTDGVVSTIDMADPRFKAPQARKATWTTAPVNAGGMYISTASGGLNFAAGEVWTFSFRYAASGMPQSPSVAMGGTAPPARTEVRGTIDHGDGTFTAWLTATFTASGSGDPILAGWGLPAVGAWIMAGDGLAEKAPTSRDWYCGSYSPDPDFTPSWTGAANASESILTGAKPLGWADSASQTATYQSSDTPASGAKLARSVALTAGAIGINPQAISPTTGVTYTLFMKVRPKDRELRARPRIRGANGPEVTLPQGEWTDVRLTGGAGSGSGTQTGLLPTVGTYQIGDRIDTDSAALFAGSVEKPFVQGDLWLQLNEAGTSVVAIKVWNGSQWRPQVLYAQDIIAAGSITAALIVMDQGFADKFWANEGNFGKVSVDMVTPNFGANLDISASGSITLLTGNAANALDAATQAARVAENAGIANGVTAERAAEAAANAAAAISANENLGRYYRFNDTDLRIGQPGAASELSISDTGISFLQNDVPVSLWDGGQMIVKSFVGEEVVLANHKIETRGARTIVRSM